MPKRVNYFDRQFLRARDFQDEQSYHLELRRQRNRALWQPGAPAPTVGLKVERLEPSPDGTARIRITKGWAVDADGQEIVLEADRELELPELAEAQRVQIFIRFAASDDEPVSYLGAEEQRFTRVSEEPRFSVVPDGEHPAGIEGAILLAVVPREGEPDISRRQTLAFRHNVLTARLADLMLADDQGGSIKLGTNQDTLNPGTPYIDFYYQGKAEEFNARIINDADGRLSIEARSGVIENEKLVPTLRVARGVPNVYAGMLRLEVDQPFEGPHRPLVISQPTRAANGGLDEWDWLFEVEQEGDEPALAIWRAFRPSGGESTAVQWKRPLQISWSGDVRVADGNNLCLTAGAGALDGPGDIVFETVVLDENRRVKERHGKARIWAGLPSDDKPEDLRLFLTADPSRANRLTIDPGGKVGIGVDEPAARLHVADGSQGVLVIQTLPGGKDPPALQLLAADNKAWNLYSGRAGSGTFSIMDTASDSDRLVIDSAGNVGVGTMEPLRAKLEVGGDVLFRGPLRISPESFGGDDPSPENSKILLYLDPDAGLWSGLGVSPGRSRTWIASGTRLRENRIELFDDGMFLDASRTGDIRLQAHSTGKIELKAMEVWINDKRIFP